MTVCGYREYGMSLGGDSPRPMDEGGPSWTRLLGLGAAIAGLVIGGAALGWFVDSHLRTFPIFVLVGIALGIVFAGAYAYTVFRNAIEK